MKKIFILALLFGFVHKAISQNTPVANASATGYPITVSTPANFTPVYNNNYLYNYVRTFRPQSPVFSTNDAQFQFQTYNSSLKTVYLNGFGQGIETIYRQPVGDIIAASNNVMSATKTKFLPFVSSGENKFQLNPFQNQSSFYSSLYPNEGGVNYTQSIASFPVLSGNSYPTPIISNYSAGKAFGKQLYSNNAITQTTTEIVDTYSPSYNPLYNIYRFTLDQNNLPMLYYTYPADKLTSKHEVGQEGEESYSIYDMDDKLICKIQNAGTASNNSNWLTTYYVYNDFGQMVYVIPPKAYTQIIANMNGIYPQSISSAIISGLCYTYVYDANGHIIQRQIPGESQPEVIVYDKLQRPVLFQSPLLGQYGNWKFIIYDNKDRPVMTGITTSPNNQAAWQTAIASNNYVSATILDYLINGYNGPLTVHDPFYPPVIPYSHILTYNYYDNYNGDPMIQNNATFDGSYYSNYSGTAITPSANYNTKGLLTATKVYTDASAPNQWATIINIYDQAGHVIQTKTQDAFTPSGQWDTHTLQYNFAGNVVRDILQHNGTVNSHKSSTLVVKQFNYDPSNGGRLTSEYQQLDNGDLRLINSYIYDNLGKVIQKSIGGVENQSYIYNIRGQLTGINPTYAQPTPAGLPDVTFGCNLNYDYGFSVPRFDGKLSGMTWRGAGTGAPLRAYGYNYDNAGRLTAADFRELTTPGGQVWSAGNSDFSMSNVTYDANGNISSMNQMGNTPTGPVPIDELTYNYIPNTNQLQSVSDQISTNYNLGDFVDGNTSSTDYSYDADGNLSADLNKGIQNITYNYQDLPTSVTVNNSQTQNSIQAMQGSIQNIYDANGRLIEKTINQNGTTDVYQYCGNFVYKNQDLQYELTEEGRCRWLTDSLFFKYEYFVRDHLGNVRTVLTSDAYNGNVVNNAQLGVAVSQYSATYEVAAANVENAYFNNVTSLAVDNPEPTTGDLKAALLNGGETGRQIGTSIMLHVMAGDKFDVSALTYWADTAVERTYVNAPQMISSLITTLAGGAGGTGVAEGSNAAYISNMQGTLGKNATAYQSLQDQASTPNVPHAYINYLVFDENMNFIPSQSGAVQIGATPSIWQQIQTASPVAVQQNGYAVIYLSNAQVTNVFANNFNITMYRGRLLEEQHYYPFGLAVKDGGQNNTPLPNKFLFETNEAHDELGMNLYDFNARQYDAQIGRFSSLDPMADGMGQESLSPYHFCRNDPANHTDPFGLGDAPATATATGGGSDAQQLTLSDLAAMIGSTSNGDGYYGTITIPGFGYTSFTTITATASISAGPVFSLSTSITTVTVGTTISMEIATSPVQTMTVNETTQSASTITSPVPIAASNPSIGDFMTATTGITFAATANQVMIAASSVSSQSVARSISSQGLTFIKSYERGPNGGVALTSYDAHDGKQTIGWGHVIKSNENFGNGITDRQADDILMNDLKSAENIINRLSRVPLSQNQFDALTSYVFNTGSFKGTRLLKNLNRGNYAGAVSEMDINTSNGMFMQGLEDRRDAEHAIWNLGIYKNHR